MHLVESSSVSMDLNTITEVAHPRTRAQLPVWTAGDAWLAGGTRLFSEPQDHLTRQIRLTQREWPRLAIGAEILPTDATSPRPPLGARPFPPGSRTSRVI